MTLSRVFLNGIVIQNVCMSVCEGQRHCTKNRNGCREELHHQYTFKGGEYCFSGEEH